MATPSLRSTSALWSAVREEDSSTSQRSGKWALWLGFLKKVCVIGNFTGLWKPEGEDEIHTSFRSFGFWLKLSFSQPIQGIKIIPRSLFLLADVHPQWNMWGSFEKTWTCCALPAGMLVSPLGFLTRLTSRSTNIKSYVLWPDLCGNTCDIKIIDWGCFPSCEFCPFVGVLLNLSLMGRVQWLIIVPSCPSVTPVSPPPATKTVVIRDMRDLLRKKEYISSLKG